VLSHYEGRTSYKETRRAYSPHVPAANEYAANARTADGRTADRHAADGHAADGHAAAPARRVTFLQPALPAYRLDFFDRLAAALGAGFRVYAPEVAMEGLGAPGAAWRVRLPARRPLGMGLHWQPGLSDLPLGRGDILVLGGDPWTLNATALLATARRRGARTIWWGQYRGAESRPWRLRLRLGLMRRADALVFYTDREAALYRAEHGRGDARPVSALNNGVDVEAIRPWRAPFAAPGRERRLLFLGRLTAKARLDLLLRAMAEPALADVRLSVVGAGPERAALDALAAERGVAGRVEFHGASTDEEIIAGIANRCHLFVYPGSVGLGLIHAMAYGLPAIVHGDPGSHMPEIAAFEDGVTGRGFAPGDPADLAGTIAAALADPASLEAFSAAGLARAEGTYNPGTMARRMLDILERLARAP
jgi:glycosyltransferase involved in cell wall biosynthesis